VANTYFQILGAQDRLRIARESLKTATGVLEVIQQRVNVGTASDLDLSQQQTVVAQLRAAIPPLQQTVDQNIATLGVLLGEPPERTVVRGGSMFRVAIPRVTPGLPSELMLQRPDIGEAEAQLAAQDANVYNARAQLFPSISLTAQGGFQSAALATLFTPQAALYTVAANATQPVFDAIRLAALLDTAKGRQIELLQNYRKAVVNAFADVERALVAVRQLALEEKSLNDAVVAARRAYQLSESQLRAGTVDITTVLNTERTLFGAKDSVAQVRLLRLQAIVSLYQALGGGWALIPPPPT
jgi:NodT family efflux transporter outer membrane factor (OMF) lipoprotein